MSPKKIHLVRHAQAEHNVGFDNYSFPDALLTSTGKEQCQSLNQRTMENIQLTAQLLVSSPLRRTLQTSLFGLPNLIERLGGRSSIVVLPSLQENGSTPADTGSCKTELKRFKEFQGIDFECLDEQWNSKTGFWAPDDQSLRNRAGWTRQWLADRTEDEIVVVSHGGALRYLTEDYTVRRSWGNTECRTYILSDEISPFGGPRLKLLSSHSNSPSPSNSTSTTPTTSSTSVSSVLPDLTMKM